MDYDRFEDVSMIFTVAGAVINVGYRVIYVRYEMFVFDGGFLLC